MSNTKEIQKKNREEQLKAAGWTKNGITWFDKLNRQRAIGLEKAYKALREDEYNEIEG